MWGWYRRGCGFAGRSDGLIFELVHGRKGAGIPGMAGHE
jgi:hypothetical protein